MPDEPPDSPPVVPDPGTASAIQRPPAPVEHDPHHQIATYREIAVRFGLGSPEAGRMKAKRSGWTVLVPNHPADVRHVRVPRAAWDAAADPPPTKSEAPPAKPTSPPVWPTEPQPPPADDGARALVALLREQVVDLKADLAREREGRSTERERAERAERRVDALTDSVLANRRWWRLFG